MEPEWTCILRRLAQSIEEGDRRLLQELEERNQRLLQERDQRFEERYQRLLQETDQRFEERYQRLLQERDQRLLQSLVQEIQRQLQPILHNINNARVVHFSDCATDDYRWLTNTLDLANIQRRNVINDVDDTQIFNWNGRDEIRVYNDAIGYLQLGNPFTLVPNNQPMSFTVYREYQTIKFSEKSDFLVVEEGHGIIGAIELKSENAVGESKSERQAILELLGLCFLQAANPFVLLTDLVNNWTFYWFSDDLALNSISLNRGFALNLLRNGGDGNEIMANRSNPRQAFIQRLNIPNQEEVANMLDFADEMTPEEIKITKASQEMRMFLERLGTSTADYLLQDLDRL